ncbi:MAG TPA: hypothetical protein DDW78_01695, partial [Treponema sp.]|nr:hypothetical protein [Treponema sp.]
FLCYKSQGFNIKNARKRKNARAAICKAKRATGSPGVFPLGAHFCFHAESLGTARSPLQTKGFWNKIKRPALLQGSGGRRRPLRDSPAASPRDIS